MGNAFLISTHINTHAHATATPTLIATPYGSHIASHLRRDTSSQLSNYVISVENYHSYAMLTTTDTPVKIRLLSPITIAGSHHQQIVYIQFNTHHRIILGQAYTNRFQNPLTQNMNPTVPIPQVHPTKGLTGRRSEKMSWATTLFQDPDTISAYEECVGESAHEVDESQPGPCNPTNLIRAQPKAIPRATTENTQRT